MTAWRISNAAGAEYLLLLRRAPSRCMRILSAIAPTPTPTPTPTAFSSSLSLLTKLVAFEFDIEAVYLTALKKELKINGVDSTFVAIAQNASRLDSIQEGLDMRTSSTNKIDAFLISPQTILKSLFLLSNPNPNPNPNPILPLDFDFDPSGAFDAIRTFLKEIFSRSTISNKIITLSLLSSNTPPSLNRAVFDEGINGDASPPIAACAAGSLTEGS